MGRGGKLSVNMPRVSVPAVTFGIVLYLIFPVVVVVLISLSSAEYLTFPPPGFSLQWYEELANTWEWPLSFAISFQVAGLCALISVLLGVPAAFALVRYALPGKSLINAAILAALITPPIIKAISVYLFYVPLGLVNTIIGLAAAHTVSGLPFVVINVAASLKGFDRSVERAAVIHGASPLGAILRVTLPIIFPAVMVGGIFAFLQSVQELLVAMFVMGTTRKPLAVKLWEGVRVEVDPTIAAASTVLIVLAVATFFLAAFFYNRSKRMTGKAV